MYKSIVFDLGGVVLDFDPKTYLVHRLCNAETEDLVYELTFGSEEWAKLDAGLLTRFEGNQQMLAKARQVGCEFEVQGVLDDWTHILRPRRKMLELIRRLKNHGYMVYYLSNMPTDVFQQLMSGPLKDVFDGGVASCEVHINKPDSRFTKLSWTSTSSKPTSVYLSMTGAENVQAAFVLGFARYSDEGQCGYIDPQPRHLQCQSAGLTLP